MTEFTGEDLTGSVFEDVYLTRARFHDVDLAGADFRLVNLTGVRIRDAALVDMDISGEISNLRVNGVDVAPLVEAELNRRYPDRAKMTPADASGFREAWEILDRLWQYAGACRPSSSRSGSTGCMPNGTSTCSRPAGDCGDPLLPWRIADAEQNLRQAGAAAAAEAAAGA